MLQERDNPPAPEGNHAPASASEEKPKPAYSHAEGWELARIIGYPGAALLTHSHIERAVMAYLDGKAAMPRNEEEKPVKPGFPYFDYFACGYLY